MPKQRFSIVSFFDCVVFDCIVFSIVSFFDCAVSFVEVPITLLFYSVLFDVEIYFTSIYNYVLKLLVEHDVSTSIIYHYTSYTNHDSILDNTK